MISLKDFAAHHRLRFTFRKITPGILRSATYKNGSHWLCTLKSGHGKYTRRLRVTYSQGSAWTTPPTLEDVLSCCKLDALSYTNNKECNEFCREYSCDNLTYISCKKMYNSLSRLLAGDHVRDYLLYEIEAS